jgi:hypothetical protein
MVQRGSFALSVVLGVARSTKDATCAYVGGIEQDAGAAKCLKPTRPDH